MKRPLNVFILTLVVMLIVGIGVSPSTVLAAATITGKVALEGTAPAAKPINFGAEKQCAIMHKDKPPVGEDLVVNPNNTVKWALVYIKDNVTGEFKAPEQAVVVNQTGCMFAPHAVTAMVGQKVDFKNDDSLLHNVRTVSKVNKVFNIAQPIQGMTTTKKFDQPEIGIQIRCDVHFWMSAYIHVLNHPFFAVTGDDGSFTIKDLPAGNYTLEVWHETLGTQVQAVTVGEGESKEIDFTLKKG